MSRTERAIFTTLCLVYDERGRILVLDRKDPNWPGICFPGGHVEPGEAFTDCAIREVWEETGLKIKNPILCGTKQFMTDDGGRYVVFFYKANRFSGQLHSSREGQVFWLERHLLPEYTTVPDFENMLKVMESDDLSEFFYYKDSPEGDWKLRLL